MSERDLTALLHQMNPWLHEEPIVFCVSDDAAALRAAIGTFREAEGLTVLLPKARADELGLPYSFVAAWLTLTVQSDLEAVGFLAAITRRLAAAGISCNVVSAVHHDHLFVPVDRGREALQLLRSMQG